MGRHPEGLAAALQRRLVPTERAVRIRRRRPRGRLVGGWGCRKTPPVSSEGMVMLLTVKDLSAWLNMKPSTLYLWAAQGKIPCRKIHGLIRFDPEGITAWLRSFEPSQAPTVPPLTRQSYRDVDQLIEAAKREVYTPACEKPDEVRAKQGG